MSNNQTRSDILSIVGAAFLFVAGVLFVAAWMPVDAVDNAAPIDESSLVEPDGTDGEEESGAIGTAPGAVGDTSFHTTPQATRVDAPPATMQSCPSGNCTPSYYPRRRR